MISGKKHRIFYFAPVWLGGSGANGDSPAATNKVLAVCGALRAAGEWPVLVSAFNDDPAVRLSRPIHLSRKGGTAVATVWARPHRGVRHRLVAMVMLLIAAMRLCRRGDRIILYNYQVEFLLLAAWFRMIGRPCVLDIEDGPRSDDASFAGVVSHWAFRLLKPLCAPRYLIVSKMLANRMELSHSLPVYGVASYFAKDVPDRTILQHGPVRINFGGTMTRDTGIELFEDALRMLVREAPDAPLHFSLTGLFDPERFRDLAAEVNATPGLRLAVRDRTGMAEYRRLLAETDVGLCLKLPDSEMGRASFPSKVIEIAATGMLLVTTASSDIPEVFSPSMAVILPDERPGSLVRSLLEIEARRAEFAERAARARQHMLDRFSARQVGLGIAQFLRGAPQ